MKRIRIYKSIQPNKTNIRHLSKKKGVYNIYFRNSKNPIYVGYSNSDLYKTILRHFEIWEHPTQYVLSFKDENKNLMNYYLTYSLNESKAINKEREEKRIFKYKPTKNKNQKYKTKNTSNDITAEVNYLVGSITEEWD